MINRNKFTKHDYVTATTINPAYKAGKYTTIVFIAFLISVLTFQIWSHNSSSDFLRLINIVE